MIQSCPIALCSNGGMWGEMSQTTLTSYYHYRGKSKPSSFAKPRELKTLKFAIRIEAVYGTAPLYGAHKNNLAASIIMYGTSEVPLLRSRLLFMARYVMDSL